MNLYLFVMLAFLLTASAMSQDITQPETQLRSWDVYTKRNFADPSLTDVIFIDLLSGERASFSAVGERFTPDRQRRHLF